jgi:hypothetical protein
MTARPVDVLSLCTDNRIKIFVGLPIATLDRMSLAWRGEGIGRMSPDAVEDRAS